MKAQILYDIGDIRYTDTGMPEANEGQALVRITCCGICGSDIPRIYKTGAHNMPLIPGHEMAGVVERCESRKELVGKRVGIFPLIPCMKCANCQRRSYEMCESYDYLGSRSDGGFAEYVRVPVWNLLPVPDEVGMEEAAMLEPMAVAVHAIRQAKLLEGTGRDSNIVVCGLGTIGLLVAMFIRDEGYKNVFCIGNKDLQRQKLLEMGYDKDSFCDARTADPDVFVMDRTDGKGADFYFECIGRSENYTQAVRLTGALGTVVLVGNPAGDMKLKRNTYWNILRKQMTLKGTWNSSFTGINTVSDTNAPADDWRYVIGRLSAIRGGGSRLFGFTPADLITHRFTLSDMDKGLSIMRDKSEEYIKIMVQVC